MRRFAALLPCLLACAANQAPALTTTSALATFDAAAQPATTPARVASDAPAAARLTPPFHATAASVRRLATSTATTNATDGAGDERDAAALGPLARAGRAP